jgi:hypothetical protein
MEYDFQTLMNNAYYLVILSFFLLTTLEAWFYLEESAKDNSKAEKLEKELVDAIDGAPMTRFVKELNRNLESGIGL